MLLHGFPPWVWATLRAAVGARQCGAGTQAIYNVLGVLHVCAVVLVGMRVVVAVGIYVVVPRRRLARSTRARPTRR